MEFFFSDPPGYHQVRRSAVGTLWDGRERVTAVRDHEVTDDTVEELEKVLGGRVVGYGPLADLARKYPIPKFDACDSGVRRWGSDTGRRRAALHGAVRRQEERRVLRHDRAVGRQLPGLAD